MFLFCLKYKVKSPVVKLGIFKNPIVTKRWVMMIIVNLVAFALLVSTGMVILTAIKALTETTTSLLFFRLYLIFILFQISFS